MWKQSEVAQWMVLLSWSMIGETVLACYTVRVENFVQFQILPYLENFAGINSTFHVYNFRVISHPRKTRN